MWTRLPLPLLGLIILGFTSCVSAEKESLQPATSSRIAYIEAPDTTEISGLAASRYHAGLLWTHNDSGGLPVLRAVDQQGKVRASVTIRGARNIDWEDMASFTLNGIAYLLVADVGDNQSVRTDCVLYLIREPTFALTDQMQNLFADIERTIPFYYEDGPRDCESIAVDPHEKSILLISKRTKPAVAYRLPLAGGDQGVALARRIGPLLGIPEPSGLLARVKVPAGLYRAQPCAFDISPDGRLAAVLTYGEIYLYEKSEGMTWRDAFASQPVVLGSHGLPQAEALCFSSDQQQIIITTEGHPAPLMIYPVPSKKR